MSPLLMDSAQLNLSLKDIATKFYHTAQRSNPTLINAFHLKYFNQICKGSTLSLIDFIEHYLFKMPSAISLDERKSAFEIVNKASINTLHWPTVQMSKQGTLIIPDNLKEEELKSFKAAARVACLYSNDKWHFHNESKLIEMIDTFYSYQFKIIIPKDGFNTLSRLTLLKWKLQNLFCLEPSDQICC